MWNPSRNGIKWSANIYNNMFINIEATCKNTVIIVIDLRMSFHAQVTRRMPLWWFGWRLCWCLYRVHSYIRHPELPGRHHTIDDVITRASILLQQTSPLLFLTVSFILNLNHFIISLEFLGMFAFCKWNDIDWHALPVSPRMNSVFTVPFWSINPPNLNVMFVIIHWASKKAV